MDLPREFNGEITFANDLFVREGWGEEVAWVQEIFRGGRFHVSAGGAISPNWVHGLPLIQCEINLQDEVTLAAVWVDMEGKDRVSIIVAFSRPGDFRSEETCVSKGKGEFFFDELRYAPEK